MVWFKIYWHFGSVEAWLKSEALRFSSRPFKFDFSRPLMICLNLDQAKFGLSRTLMAWYEIHFSLIRVELLWFSSTWNPFTFGLGQTLAAWFKTSLSLIWVEPFGHVCFIETLWLKWSSVKSTSFSLFVM